MVFVETIDDVGVYQVLQVHVITVAIQHHDYRSYGQSIVAAQRDVMGRMLVATRRWFEIGGFRPKSSRATFFSRLKGHCIEFKYYADGIHSGLTPPG